jgi:hypothetical protein
MQIEFYVEEPSIHEALQNLVPKIVGNYISFSIYVHNGKLDLFKKLPARLRRYQHWSSNEWRIVVMVDEDRQDCKELKSQLEKAAHDAN